MKKKEINSSLPLSLKNLHSIFAKRLTSSVYAKCFRRKLPLAVTKTYYGE